VQQIVNGLFLSQIKVQGIEEETLVAAVAAKTVCPKRAMWSDGLRLANGRVE
jgi:hypothetical protein